MNWDNFDLSGFNRLGQKIDLANAAEGGYNQAAYYKRKSPSTRNDTTCPDNTPWRCDTTKYPYIDRECKRLPWFCLDNRIQSSSRNFSPRLGEYDESSDESYSFGPVSVMTPQPSVTSQPITGSKKKDSRWSSYRPPVDSNSQPLVTNQPIAGSKKKDSRWSSYRPPVDSNSQPSVTQFSHLNLINEIQSNLIGQTSRVRDIHNTFNTTQQRLRENVDLLKSFIRTLLDYIFDVKRRCETWKQRISELDRLLRECKKKITIQPSLPTQRPFGQPSLPTQRPDGQPSLPTQRPDGQPSLPTQRPYGQPSPPTQRPYSQPSPYGQPSPPTQRPDSQPIVQWNPHTHLPHPAIIHPQTMVQPQTTVQPQLQTQQRFMTGNISLPSFNIGAPIISYGNISASGPSFGKVKGPSFDKVKGPKTKFGKITESPSFTVGNATPTTIFGQQAIGQIPPMSTQFDNVTIPQPLHHQPNATIAVNCGDQYQVLLQEQKFEAETRYNELKALLDRLQNTKDDAEERLKVQQLQIEELKKQVDYYQNEWINPTDAIVQLQTIKDHKKRLDEAVAKLGNIPRLTAYNTTNDPELEKYL